MDEPTIRRVVTQGASGASNAYWILFEAGHMPGGVSQQPESGITKPVLLLTDGQVDRLLDQVEAERKGAIECVTRNWNDAMATCQRVVGIQASGNEEERR